MKSKIWLCAVLMVLLPAMAHAADLTGVPKIRDGDQITIGNTRIRLGGIDAPSGDQLCLNNNGERWTCGVAAREALVKHVGNKSWTCHIQNDRSPRPHGGALRCRWRGYPEMDGRQRLGAGVRPDFPRLRGG